MAKKLAPALAATGAPAAPPAAPEAPPLPLPTKGGCWVRLADGSLAEETPAEAPAEEQAP